MPNFRIGFNADPDTGSQTNADPCGSGYWSGFKNHKKLYQSQKVEFVHETGIL
jgi:hypothetical protein